MEILGQVGVFDFAAKARIFVEIGSYYAPFDTSKRNKKLQRYNYWRASCDRCDSIQWKKAEAFVKRVAARVLSYSLSDG